MDKKYKRKLMGTVGCWPTFFQIILCSTEESFGTNCIVSKQLYCNAKIKEIKGKILTCNTKIQVLVCVASNPYHLISEKQDA